MRQQPSQKHADRTVVVVGGGLAGIAAAAALAREGVHVRLLEARRRLGGRTGSFLATDQPTPETVDYCQHVGMGCCTNLKQLISWLGQEPQWTEYSDLHFYGADGGYQRLSALPWLPAPLHLAGWLWRWPNLGSLDRVAIARGMLALRRVPVEGPGEAQSALAWLQAHHQTARSLEQFWKTLVVSALGEQLNRVSLAAVAKVLQDGFLNHRQAFHLLVPQAPLETLFNAKAQAYLQDLGCNVELGTAVTGLARTDRGLVVEARQQSYHADAVVLAIPWHQLPKLAAAAQIPQLTAVAGQAAHLTSSPITGIHTWWDRPWLDQPHATVVGRLCQWVFAAPDAAPRPPASGGAAATYYQIVISASRELPAGAPQQTEALIREDLAAVFPRSRAARLLGCKVVTDPQAVFSVSPESLEYRPGTKAVAKDILLAGDWTRTGWPATMEGAILSGFRAAQAALAAWGRNRTVEAPGLGRTDPPKAN